MDEEVPSTSSDIKTDRKSFKRLYTLEEKEYVAEKIKPSEFRSFFRFLGLEESKIDAVETDCKGNNYGFRETIYQMLIKWEQIKGDEATVEVLISALNCIQRNDIVQHLFPDYYHRKQQPMNEHLQEMQQKQSKKFRHLMLPRTLWLAKKRFTLEEHYVELTMKKKDKWGKEEDISIEREEIFHEIEIEKNIKNSHRMTDSPRRVLVEGHPGYGKTTLISKLLFDWSREEKYVRDKFDLIYVIPLRNFKGNLENHLLQQIKNVNGSDADKMKTLREVEGRVLLLLDGLDECNERIKESLVPLFNGDQYPHMTVLVTSRTGFIHFQQESDDNFEIMGNMGFEYHLIWDKRIQIKGISPKKRLEFLQKCLNINSNDLKRIVEQFNFENNNLYECPLFLLLFAVFAQEGQKVALIKTRTDLYRRIFNFVLSRNLNRENLLEEEFDVFDVKMKDQLACRNILFRFGQLCVEKMKKQSLIFEERELLECSDGDEIILKLGFVSKDINFDNYEEEKHYEPIHRSFLEFLAAFYLSFLNEVELKREIKELTLKYNIWPEGDQLLYPFLGGLLQENAYKLFDSFSLYACDLNVFWARDPFFNSSYHLDEILIEIPENDDIYKSLIPFVPPFVDTPSLKSSPVIKRWLCGYLDFLKRTEISNNIILFIPDNVDELEESPFEVNTVEVDLVNHCSFKSEDIKCHNLKIRCGDIRNYSINGLNVILSKIKADKIFLSFYYSLVSAEKPENFTFNELITARNFQNFSIHHLKMTMVNLDLSNKVLTLIEYLIESKKIETGIDIEFFSGNFNRQQLEKVNSFLEFVFKSHLTAIDLSNSGDKPITLKLNEKQWKCIKLSGKFRNINTNEIHSFSVEHLDIRGLSLIENNWNWLKKCTGLKRLQCKSSLISEFSKLGFDDWFGYEDFEFLEFYSKTSNNFYYSDMENFSFFLSVISHFKNLQEIKTPLHKCQEYLFKLLSVVPSVKKICLYKTDLCDYLSAVKFLEKELSVKNEKVEIDFRMDESQYCASIEKSSLNDFCEVLEKCFLKNVLVSFSYPVTDLFYDSRLLMKASLMMRRALCNYFLSREGFMVGLTWEDDRNCSFEFPELTLKINISYEFSDKNLSFN